MTEKNKHGLSRYIPADVRLEVRKAAGFGCVICGAAIGEYAHIDPPFADAKEHCAEGITFLCVQHHGKETRGLLSRETIRKAMTDPWCHQFDHCHEAFDIDAEDAHVVLGGSRFYKTNILSVDNVPLLKILPPVELGAPYRLSGRFYDASGQLCLEIENNHWKARSKSWDIEVVGTSIRILDSTRKPALS